GGIERSIDADAEQAIDDQRRPKCEQGFQFSQVRFRIAHIQCVQATFVQVLQSIASVSAVISFAGQDQDEIARGGETKRTFGNRSTDAPNDFRRGFARCPRSRFPFAHLTDANDWYWHW